MRSACTATTRTFEELLIGYLILDSSEIKPFSYVLQEGNGRSSSAVFQAKIFLNQQGMAETGSNENTAERARTVWEEVGSLMPRTPLGRRLWAIRRRIVASGTPLLGWEEIDREIAIRRGERE